MDLSVIVPAFNEESGLKKNIDLYDSYLRSQPFSYEIIIVNDGSTDNTEKIAKRLADEKNSIKMISTEKNSGKGSAIRTGLLAGKGDYLLFIDADNATNINHLEKTWPLLQSGTDIVIGSRNKKDAIGAMQAIPQNIFKRFMGILGNKLIRLFTGCHIHDTQCGFKIMNRKSANIILPKSKINRYAIDIEILLIAKKHNLRIGIIPIVWHCGPTSRVSPKAYIQTLLELLKIKINQRKGFYD